MCFAPQQRALFRTSHLPKVVRSCRVSCILTSKCAFGAATAYTLPISQLPQVVRAWCFLCFLTSKCDSRHNGLHFFRISTSRSGLRIRCFVHVKLETGFASQRRAFFRLSSGLLAPQLRTRIFFLLTPSLL